MSSKFQLVNFFQRTAFATSALRWKGHSKWQNIKDTKTKNDQERSKLICQYMTRLRHLVNIHEVGDLDLSKGKIAGLLKEYSKHSLKKDTFVKNFERAMALKRQAVQSSSESPSDTG